MSVRRCEYEKCGASLPVFARADARFCCPEHKSAHHNEERRKREATAKRLDGASAGVGSRGGNVRSVEEARSLQAAYKPEWTARIHRRIGVVLVTTGGFHPDDLQVLEVPEAHSQLIGTQIASYVNRKLMVKVGERPCKHKAANSRKGGIYEITAKGRKELAGLDTENPEGSAGSVEQPESPAPSTGRGLPMGIPRGAGSSVGVQSGETRVGPGGANVPRDAAGLASAESPVSPAPTASRLDSPDLVHAGILPASSPYSGENEFA